MSNEERFSDFADYLAHQADEELRDLLYLEEPEPTEKETDEIVEANRPAIFALEQDGTAWGYTLYPEDNHPRLFLHEGGRSAKPNEEPAFADGTAVTITVRNKHVADFLIKALQSVEWDD